MPHRVPQKHNRISSCMQNGSFFSGIQHTGIINIAVMPDYFSHKVRFKITPLSLHLTTHLYFILLSEDLCLFLKKKKIHLMSSNFDANPLVPNPAAYPSSSILVESSSSQAIQNSELCVRDTERHRVRI